MKKSGGRECNKPENARGHQSMKTAIYIVILTRAS